MNKESRPCTFCGWAMGEREGEPLCSHCKKSNRKNKSERKKPELMVRPDNKQPELIFNSRSKLERKKSVEQDIPPMPEVKPPRESGELTIHDLPKTLNNMRCCSCKLPKEPGVLICKCCGGTTYEGFYDFVIARRMFQVD